MQHFIKTTKQFKQVQRKLSLHTHSILMPRYKHMHANNTNLTRQVLESLLTQSTICNIVTYRQALWAERANGQLSDNSVLLATSIIQGSLSVYTSCACITTQLLREMVETLVFKSLKWKWNEIGKRLHQSTSFQLPYNNNIIIIRLYAELR